MGRRGHGIQHSTTTYSHQYDCACGRVIFIKGDDFRSKRRLDKMIELHNKKCVRGDAIMIEEPTTTIITNNNGGNIQQQPPPQPQE